MDIRSVHGRPGRGSTPSPAAEYVGEGLIPSRTGAEYSKRLRVLQRRRSQGLRVSVTQERGDDDPDEHDQDQGAATGHEELAEGVIVPARSLELGRGVTFFGRTFLGFPF